MALSDEERDHFFAQLYERTTEPLLTPQMTAAEVRSFLALARPEPNAQVVDLGCGWGRHLRALREAGVRPIGVERARPYVERARRETGCDVVRADVRRLPLRSGSIAAIGCFYSSIFFFDETGNEQALSEVARVLAPGGCFVLQTASPLHLRRLGREAQTFELPGVQVEERTTFDREAGIERGWRRATLADGTTLEGGYDIRHYAPGELEVHARKVGLRVEEVFGSLDHAPFNRMSREMIVLLRKR